MVNHGHGIRGVAIVCCLYFLVYLGNSLWLSLFPNYLAGLGMDSLVIGVILMIYNGSLSLTYLPSGRLSDRVGRRPLIMVGCSILAVATLFLSLINHVETMILAVIVGGIGLALLIPSGNALISEVISDRGSGSAFALYEIAILSASVVGSFAAGTFAENVGFSMVFLLSAMITAGAAAFGYAMVPETIVSEAGGYVSAVGQSLRSSATGTVRMLQSNRELALLTGALVIHGIAFSMINPFIPLFAEEGIHLDISHVGMLISFWNAGLTLAQFPSGRLTDRFGAKPLLLAHLVLSSLSFVLYALSWNYESGIATMLFLGVVGALDMPARRTIMIEYASAEAGKATIIGSLDAITGTVGIVGPLIGGVIWAQMGLAAPFLMSGFINAFACVPLLAIMLNRTRASV